jgi:PKD repeat protein
MKVLRFLTGMLLMASFLYADYNIEIHFNYPAETVFIGEINTVEFWIENDDTLQGMTLGFEFSGYAGTIAWDSLYGSNPPLNIEDPDAVDAFLGGVAVITYGLNAGTPEDTILLGGAYMPPDNLGLPSSSARVCYSMQFSIPEGQSMGSLCVDNIIVPPGGAWIVDIGAGPFAPDYFDCVNTSYNNPDCPAVCVPVVTKEVEADFSFTPDCGVAPAAIQFSDNSTLNPQAWKWYFDDGDSSTEQNPEHIYTAAGEYYPTLIASNSYNADTLVSPDPVIIYDSMTLDFNADVTDGLTPLVVQFTSSFNPTPDYLVWYFGDGDSSNLPNPTHNYTEGGLYDVTFAAVLCGTRDSLVKAGYINAYDYICGDANSDGVVNVSDVMFIRSYMFGGGATPSPLESADADECGSVNISDIAYIQEFVWLEGPAPCEGSVTCYLPSGNNAISLGCPVQAFNNSGDSVAIPVFLTSEIDLTGFYFGFEYNSADITITSLDLSESILNSNQQITLQAVFHSQHTYPFESKVLFGWFISTIESESIAPQTNGELFKMWIQVPSGTPVQSVDIDTCSAVAGLPAGEILLSALGGGSIKPSYVDCGTEDLIISEPDYICGDANSDEDVNVSDAVYIINYVFVGGDAPDPLESGDVNCDDTCNVSDAVWIINYVFVGGNEPCDTSGDGIPDC